MKKILVLLVVLLFGSAWAAGSKLFERDIPEGFSAGVIEKLDLAAGVVIIDGSPMALAPGAQAELRSFIRDKGRPEGMPAIYQLKDRAGSRIVEHLVPRDERDMDY